MIHYSPTSDTYTFSAWLQAGANNNGAQGGAANAAPVFVAPQPGEPIRSEPAIGTGAERLHKFTLEKVFGEGSPDMVSQATKFLAERKRLGDSTLHSFLVSVIARRTDPQALACFRQLLSGMNVTASALIHGAMTQRQFALAKDVVTIDPGAAGAQDLREAMGAAPELARTIADLRPDLERRLGPGEFMALYLEPGIVQNTPAPAKEVRALALKLIARFPHRADALACRLMHLDDGSLTEAALSMGSLPHTGSFWGNALMRFPRIVADSLVSRPDAVDCNLIYEAGAAWAHDILEQACKINPAAVNERNGAGNTPAHKAASFNNFDAMKILARHGADMQAKNDDGETPFSIAPLAVHFVGSDAVA